MSKKISFIAVGAVLAAAGWLALKSDTPAKIDTTVSATSAKTATSRDANASGVFVDNALKPANVRRAATSIVMPLKSLLAMEFEKGLNLKQFYDRYVANPQTADAETKFFAAAALETCQWKTRNQPPSEAANQRFLSRLKDNDPNNSQRIDAYNRINAACDGFQNSTLTPADTSRLYAEAAAAGNPAAKAAVAAEQYRDQARNARGVEERRLSEDQLGLVREALSSGDPFAIRRAGNLLTYESTQLADRKLGAEGDPFNARDFGPAWTFLACDRGANCGPDANRVLQGCANQGACGYQSLQSYMQFNELSPNAYANAQRYSAMIADAIAQGRWDLLGIAPGSGRTVAPPNQAGLGLAGATRVGVGVAVALPPPTPKPGR
jgi:hypothetical protein